MVPSAACGWAPKVMAQEPAPGDDSVHLPARLVGGATPAGAAFIAVLSAAGRSVVQQPASRVAARTRRVAKRMAIDMWMIEYRARVMVSRKLRSCQGGGDRFASRCFHSHKRPKQG